MLVLNALCTICRHDSSPFVAILQEVYYSLLHNSIRLSFVVLTMLKPVYTVFKPAATQPSLDASRVAELQLSTAQT